MKVPAVTAPDWGDSASWVNTERAYSLKELKGKLVLLDFWTFGCINCQQIIPDLHRLEERYKDHLVVIGIHSAKFKAERAGFRIKSAADRLGISHPVINDADFKIWDDYAVKAWPTLVLIDHRGKVIWQRAGEGFYQDLDAVLEEWTSYYEDDLNSEILAGLGSTEHEDLLKYPAGLALDTDGNIWIADAGNHRILKVDSTGKILHTVGSGKAGLKNGSFNEAQFFDPQGLSVEGDTIWVADTRNHALRVFSMIEKTVTTPVGDGKQGKIAGNSPRNSPVFPASPWAIFSDSKYRYVANAGNHRILSMEIGNGNLLSTWWGTGREALVDGSSEVGSFNQPSALALWKHYLLVADAEASAIRAIDLEADSLKTLVGRGLFVFGYQDGPPEQALLQHPQGLSVWKDTLYIADTYNGCIRSMALPSGPVQTLISGLKAPVGIVATEKHLWITDSDAHQLLKADRMNGNIQVVDIRE